MQKYNNIEKNFFNKFVSVLSKKGSQSKAKSIVVCVFSELQLTLKTPLSLLLVKAWKRLDVYVECRKVRIRRKYFNIPFIVTAQRRILLALKWIVSTALLNTKNISLAKKLYNEFLILNTEKESEVLKLKTLNNEAAQANRANMHYRW